MKEHIKTPLPLHICVKYQISVLVPNIFVFEKCVKYTNEMTDDVIHSTRHCMKNTKIMFQNGLDRKDAIFIIVPL